MGHATAPAGHGANHAADRGGVTVVVPVVVLLLDMAGVIGPLTILLGAAPGSILNRTGGMVTIGRKGPPVALGMSVAAGPSPVAGQELPIIRNRRALGVVCYASVAPFGT